MCWRVRPASAATSCSTSAPRRRERSPRCTRNGCAPLGVGILLALLVMAPVFGIGVYLFRKGGQEQQEMVQVQKEKQILNAVLTRGQVSISELVAEMQLPRDEIEQMIHNLVGKQLFSGAINWEAHRGGSARAAGPRRDCPMRR